MVKVFLFLCLLAFSSCAVQQYPSGGQKDTIEPNVVNASIKSGTINFSNREIEFEFSKYMDKNSVKNALFISPPMKDKYELKWDGYFVRLVFKETLLENMTYVISIGSTAMDRRGGNHLNQTYQLAFSTGNEIDTMMIVGRVFDNVTLQGISGATILAYNLTTHTNPNPEKDQADYFTQSGADGSFLLGYLKASHYRIFSIQENYKNERWETNEPIGIGLTQNIPSQGKPDTSYSFYLSKPDWESPKIEGVVAESNKMLKVTFNEEVSQTNSEPSFKLLGAETEKPIDSYIYSLTTKNQIYISVDSLSDGNYSLLQTGISDMSFNRSVADTFSFTYNTKDLSKKVRLQSYPSDTNSVLGLMEQIKILYADKQSIDSVRFYKKPNKSNKWSKVNDVIFTNQPNYLQIIQSKLNWEEEQTYRGMIFSGKDTLLVGFRTLSASEKGALSGYFVQSNLPSTTYVELINTEDKNYFKTEVTGNQFEFKEIPAGRYTLTAYSDLNGNKKWDSGTAFPWSASEPKYFSSDTIKIRARWTLEDVKMQLR